MGSPDRGITGYGDRELGEVVSIPERLVVAPVLGRVRLEALQPDDHVDEGTPLGWIRRPRPSGRDVTIRAPVSGTLLSWLAVDGHRVRRGMPIARLRPRDAWENETAELTLRS